LKKWLRRFIVSVAVTVLSSAAIAAIFMARPEFFLTSRTAGILLVMAGKSYSPSWSTLSFTAAAVGRRRHRYVLRSEGFCAADKHGTFTGCFRRVEVNVVVRYDRNGPHLESLDNLTLVGDSVSVDLTRSEAGQAAKPPPAGLFLIPVRAFSLDLPSFTFQSPTSEVEGVVSASLSPSSSTPLAASADVIFRTPRLGSRRLSASLAGTTDLFLAPAPPTFLEAVLVANSPRVGRARASMSVRRRLARYEGSGAVEVVLSTGPIRSFRLSRCRGSAVPDSRSLETSCRYSVSPRATPDPRFPDLKLAAGDLRARGSIRGEQLSASLSASLDPVLAWYRITGGVDVAVSGRLSRPFSEFSLRQDSRAAVRVPRFDDLVAFLRESSWPVPAPIHVLHGPLELSVLSSGDPRAPSQTVRYALTSDLSGKRQRLRARAAGNFTAFAGGGARSIQHTGELMLRDIALELPRLEVGGTPKITVDPRITPGGAPSAPSEPEPAKPLAHSAFTGPETRRRPLTLSSRLSIRTEQPVFLFSNLAKDPVPVALDLVATYPPAAARGKVSAGAFDIELFRRRAKVDHFNVALSSSSMVAELEGLVVYKTPSVDIHIMILGTTERPRVELASVPPLKREDIIALLIFGKSPDELDIEQTASVNNTETALESRAFGLASLYLFGATPIEHVGYDSATKTTSVKLRLPGGANLTLGSDFDQSRQLTVRKPLARHWALMSEVGSQGSTQQSRGAATFLEWFNRY